ncbi:cytochrome P450, partial [Planktothrix sp. FACHB-1355]
SVGSDRTPASALTKVHTVSITFVRLLSPERAEHKKQEFSLIGFGGGPRICLGIAFAQMEMKIVAAHLLRNYTWELLPEQNLTLDAVPMLHPKDGLRVNFRRI